MSNLPQATLDAAVRSIARTWWLQDGGPHAGPEWPDGAPPKYLSRASVALEAALPVLLAGGLPSEPSEETVRYAAGQLAPLFLDDGEPVDPYDLVRYVARCLMIRDSGGYVSNVETCSPGLGGLRTDSLRWLAEQLQYRSEAHAKLIGDAVAGELASRSAGPVSGTT